MTGLERWKGKTAIVTGASSGIGSAVARRLSESGFRVALCARRLDRLREVAESVPGDALAIQCDLRNEGQILRAMEQVRSQWGGVDVLVNNAGLGHDAPLTSGETESWREMLEVNVLGLCIFTREAVQDMQHRGGEGHVIHISSMAAHRVPGGSGVYSATKFAVRSLTEGLRQELRDAKSPIRVTAVSPGFVETEFASIYHGDEAAAKKTYGRYKVLESADVAEAVAYVLSCPPHVQVHDVLMRPTDQPG